MGAMLLGVALTVVLMSLAGPPPPKTVVHETVWFKAGRPAHRWLAVQYHRPAFPAVKSPSGALQFWVPLFDRFNVDLVYEAGKSIASSAAWPTWSAGSEFRAVRESTAGQRK